MCEGVRYVGCSVTEWHDIDDEEDESNIYPEEEEEFSMKEEQTWAALTALNREAFEKVGRARAHREAQWRLDNDAIVAALGASDGKIEELRKTLPAVPLFPSLNGGTNGVAVQELTVETCGENGGNFGQRLKETHGEKEELESEGVLGEGLEGQDFSEAGFEEDFEEQEEASDAGDSKETVLEPFVVGLLESIGESELVNFLEALECGVSRRELLDWVAKRFGAS